MADRLHDLTVWLRLLQASIMGQLSYRRSFLLEVVGRFVLTTLELVAVVALFQHIDALAGWTQWEVVYLYGMASLALGLSELFTDGLNQMGELVRQGTLDGILVRPVSPLMQVLGRQCRPFHLGRALQGVLAMGLALASLGWVPTATGAAMLVVNVLATATVFAALFVAGAATQVYTVQSAEAFNAFTYGGVQMAQYPLPVYPRWLQGLFVFAVPVGFTAYFPAVALLGKPDVFGLGPAAPWLAPVVAALYFGLAVLWWRRALNHYQSTGS